MRCSLSDTTSVKHDNHIKYRNNKLMCDKTTLFWLWLEWGGRENRRPRMQWVWVVKFLGSVHVNEKAMKTVKSLVVPQVRSLNAGTRADDKQLILRHGSLLSGKCFDMWIRQSQLSLRSYSERNKLQTSSGRHTPTPGPPLHNCSCLEKAVLSRRYSLRQRVPGASAAAPRCRS